MPLASPPAPNANPTPAEAAASPAPGGAGARQLVPVVVDPLLARSLRPHQRTGVQFLYDAVTGRAPGALGLGCVLADDMGLGKTLQTITLIWTLLKQSPSGGNAPTIAKAVFVCPSSLVLNWRQEFKKWLGDPRCQPLAVNSQGAEAKAAVNEFIVGKAPVLLISYEMLRKHAGVLTSAASAARIGLLVCDEAHRLKSAGGSQTIDALASEDQVKRLAAMDA